MCAVFNITYQLFFRQVFYLVDDVLILALGSEINAETADGTDDAADATTPEDPAAKGATMKLVGLVQEPTHPQNNGGNAKEQPVGFELLGAGHFFAGLDKITVHQVGIVDFTQSVVGGACTDEHKDAGNNPEEDGEA